MDSNVDAALAAKLSLLFPPREDAFLAFPLSGAAFRLEELDLFADGNRTAEKERLRSHRKAQFARILNQIPEDSVIYEPSDRLLWDEYRRVIERSELADSVLTPGEQERLRKARDYLEDAVEIDGLETATAYSPQAKAYYVYKEAFEDAERVYLDEKVTVQASEDPELTRIWEQSREAQLSDLLERARSDWQTLGFKDQVEEAQAILTALGARSPEILRQDLRSDFEQCIETDLVANDPNGVLSTFYSPSDIFHPDVPWETLHLTRNEIAELHKQAPERMRGNATDDLGNIEEITVEYADVTVMRPWYYRAWFDMRSWRLPLDDSQVVSDGEIPRRGRIPAVIGSMIVARRISVVRRGKASGEEASPGLVSLNFTPLIRAQGLVQEAAAVGQVTAAQRAVTTAAERSSRITARQRGKRPGLQVNPALRQAREAGVTISRMSTNPTIRADLRKITSASTIIGATSLAAAANLPKRKIRVTDPVLRAGPAVRDHRTSAGDGGASVRDRRTSARDESASVRDRRTSARDESASVRDHRTSARNEGAAVRDHRQRIEQVLARRGRNAAKPDIEPDTESQEATTHEVEEIDLDCVVVLAYRCRRTPESPRPDPQLPWSGDAVHPGPPEHDQNPGAQPPYPLPSGHFFSEVGSERSHNGTDSETDRESVRWVQERLRDLGYDLVVDGYYGYETVTVVRTFQDAASLEADGIVGPDTWQALKESDHVATHG